MKSHVWHAGMHPKMPIQLIECLGQPILKFYRTTMILDDIMIILAPRCDISKICYTSFAVKCQLTLNYAIYKLYKIATLEIL